MRTERNSSGSPPEPLDRRIVAREAYKGIRDGCRRGRGVRLVALRAIALPQHPDQHRSQHPVLLLVDQQLGEGAALWVTPELADPVGAFEVEDHQDVEQFGAETPTPANATVRPGGRLFQP